jgi:hypothetical protein
MYLLGEALKTTGAKVDYNSKETAASQLSLLHLTTNFGDIWGKGLYKIEDGEKYSYDLVYKDERMMSKFL